MTTWKTQPSPDDTALEKLTTALKTKNTQSDTDTKKQIARLLFARGIKTFQEAKDFFRPSKNQLHNPFQMKDMAKAVKRLEKAISDNEKIMVFGDYDVDGVTSVALMTDYLSRFTTPISYIPDRYTEGYGISLKGIDTADKKGVSLIIALDCGITAVAQVAYAASKNIDFIICDHHQPNEKNPRAFAILNPQQTDCNYPYKNLCGCGVGFKLVQAHHQKRGGGLKKLSHYLQWVAIAIAADIVPLTDENRLLCFWGLKIINSEKVSLGVQTLKNPFKIPLWEVKDLVFKIAPLLNAAGRMGNAMEAVKMLLSTDLKQAESTFEILKKHNTNRQKIERNITKEALLQIETDKKNNASTIVYKENWHKGVLGIVASRLIENHYRPTIVLTKSNGFVTGSVRSVEGVDVYEALKKCKEYLKNFGGHKAAAGLTLPLENYEKFKRAFDKNVAESITPEQKKRIINIDLSIDLKEIRGHFWRILKQFAPFGPENMRPVFHTKNLLHNGTLHCMLNGKSHIKMIVSPADNPDLKFVAVGFKMAQKTTLAANEPFEMVYKISENHWGGNTDLQIEIQDLRPM